MTPRQARRILREMNRSDRRHTFHGIYKYTVDGGRTFYTIDRHGIPTLISIGNLAVSDESAMISPEAWNAARAMLDAATQPTTAPPTVSVIDPDAVRRGIYKALTIPDLHA